MDNQFAYSVPEFCKLASIGKWKLYDLWKRGDGPPSIRCGRRRLITREAALKWFREQENKAGADYRPGLFGRNMEGESNAEPETTRGGDSGAGLETAA